MRSLGVAAAVEEAAAAYAAYVAAPADEPTAADADEPTAADADEPTADDNAVDGTPTAAVDQAAARAVPGSRQEIAHRTVQIRHTVRSEVTAVNNYLRTARKKAEIVTKVADTAAGLHRTAPIRRTARSGDTPADKYAQIALRTVEAQAEIARTAVELSRTEVQADRLRNLADRPTPEHPGEDSPENCRAKIPETADLPRAFLAKTSSSRWTS